MSGFFSRCLHYASGRVFIGSSGPHHPSPVRSQDTAAHHQLSACPTLPCPTWTMPSPAEAGPPRIAAAANQPDAKNGSGQDQGPGVTGSGAIPGRNAEIPDYPILRQRGFDIDSGPTEMFCKTSTARLKGGEMRWASPDVEGMYKKCCDGRSSVRPAVGNVDITIACLLLSSCLACLQGAIYLLAPTKKGSVVMASPRSSADSEPRPTLNSIECVERISAKARRTVKAAKTGAWKAPAAHESHGNAQVRFESCHREGACLSFSRSAPSESASRPLANFTASGSDL